MYVFYVNVYLCLEKEIDQLFIDQLWVQYILQCYKCSLRILLVNISNAFKLVLIEKFSCEM